MSENELTKLKRRRGLLRASLTRFKGFLDDYVLERDYSILKIRFEKANSLLSEFESVHMAIELAEDINDDESRQSFEDNYYKQLARAQEYLEAGQARTGSINATTAPDFQTVLSQLNTLTSNDNNVKLPTIALPKFEGKYEEWLSFEDSFKALVHNNTKIQTVQKFNYLKSCLIGSAAQVIHSLSSTAESYEIAWNLLKERYSNKRIIIQNHVRALFELQAVTRESALGLSALVDTALKHIHSLQVLEQPTKEWDALLLHLIGSKVDKRTQMEWEKSLDSTEMPTLNQYLKFLRNRCHVLEAIPKEVSIATTQRPFYSSKITPIKARQVLFDAQVKCQVCGENHNIQSCEKFKAMSQSEKSESIRKAGLCFNCFRSNHKVSACKASNCKKCDRKHHTMLHPRKAVEGSQTKEERSEQPKQSKEQESNPVSQTLSSQVNDSSQIILSTAVVDIVDAYGQYHSCRVVLDAGSQSNFMSEQFCNKLKLCTIPVNIPIKGIGETLSYIKYSTVGIIKSRSNAFTLKLNCLVIPKITDVLPARNINRKALGIPNNVKLADPNFDRPAQIDMLIGAEHFYHLLCIGQIKLQSGSTILQKTKLGWIVSGKADLLAPSSVSLCHFSRSSLDEVIQKFWEIEELPARKIWSPEEEKCEQHYKQTIERLSSGQYSVRLPFNEQRSSLGESYRRAVKRLQGLEKRLIANPELYAEYRNFLQEYESLGHMTEIKEVNIHEGYFLPYHAVLKESSLTTKLRVVFDASAKTTSGLSLNNTLLVGLTVQQDLFAIVLRFRLHNIVFTADIQKMYRQVLVHPEDRKYQKILWRDRPEDTIRIYELNTVTYGMAPASYLATRTLLQLCEDELQNYREATETITKDMYVDDLLTGSDTLERAILMKNQITSLLNSGGFNLRKWASNHPSVLGSTTCDSLKEHWQLDSSETHKTLGIFWNPQQDCFIYRFTRHQDFLKITKRSILSRIASLYDPLGLLSPVIVKAKILLQTLWKLQLAWDETVPMEVHTAWKTLQENMPKVNEISFPRQVCLEHSTNFQLIGFADASEAAYGACIYVRSSNTHNSHRVMLVCSKSRVAPLKQLSLPRLELNAALLLSQLCQLVLKAFNITFTKVILWSDSTITLQWIRAHPHRLKTYVANRVASIQEITSSMEWRHIRSQDNPADLVSRGAFPSELVNNSMWLYGPAWLTEDEQTWPNHTFTLSEIPEQRGTVILKAERSFELLQQFSSIVMLRRVVAWCFRFIDNCKAKRKTKGILVRNELNRAMTMIIRLVQSETFPCELRRLRTERCLESNSKLLSLHPFLDSEGILRVGGRLKHSTLNYEQKHQVILPEKHYVTDLIIKHVHCSQLHVGPQATLYHIRQRFWPINGKNRVKKVVPECVICFKAKPRMSEHTIGDLPKDRFKCSRPFINTGVDYCGPFWIKEKKYRNRTKIKVYVSIFVCFSSKAVHLELVSDLTTEAFIAALKRFFSRRGKANLMFSDNATNFVGANNTLRDLYKFVNSDSHKKAILEWLSKQEVSWKFIPPRSLHFGGIWEAAVRSFKHHLVRVARDTLFTFEEFNTLIIEIEAVLNSRPLTPLSSDPDDLNPLTPSHFLIGDSLLSIPEVDYTNVNTNKLSSWQHIQKIKRDFWNRWNKEYLTELTQRTKCKFKASNVKKGDLVILREDKTPSLYWPMGRITELYPGTDDVVKVVKVKTAIGSYKRAVKNVAPLPIGEYLNNC